MQGRLNMSMGYCEICNRFCDEGHVHWGNVYCKEKPMDIMYKGRLAIRWVYSTIMKKWIGLNHLGNRVR